MRTAPGETWQVIIGTGGRGERRDRRIIRPAMSRALAALRLARMEWIIS